LSHSKPFHRNYRGFVKRQNSGYSQWAYIIDREYSDSSEHYVRAFLLIQSDLQKLFEFIEPSDCNLDTYSFRIHELLMRTCIEIEANFKAILKENIYNPTNRERKPIPENKWNIHNYRIVNKTHHLSSYKVYIPIWDGTQSSFEPFAQWATATELPWYQAYNNSKHDRKSAFKEANFFNLLNAIAGLLVLLSSQFRTEDFAPGSRSLGIEGYDYYSHEPALGGFFHIDFPNDWNEEEKYDFDWAELKKETDRFQKIDYDKI
jgi:hypothetical protein